MFNHLLVLELSAEESVLDPAISFNYFRFWQSGWLSRYLGLHLDLSILLFSLKSDELEGSYWVLCHLSYLWELKPQALNVFRFLVLIHFISCYLINQISIWTCLSRRFATSKDYFFLVRPLKIVLMTARYQSYESVESFMLYFDLDRLDLKTVWNYYCKNERFPLLYRSQ